jgi:hypothetical protein
MKLTFTPEAWAATDAAIRLRNQGEIHLGWWHSHPIRAWCQNCPAERQAVCRYNDEFFSEHDAALHRAVFPRSYSVALVVNDRAAGDLTHSMFGWWMGQIAPRGFHVR